MIRQFCIAACVIASMLAASPTMAQPTAHLYVPHGCAVTPVCYTALITVAPDTQTVLSEVRLPTLSVYREYATPEGQFVAWLESGNPLLNIPARIGLYDVLSGATVKIESPGVTDLLGNPARAELFLADATGPFALALSGTRRFASPSCTYAIFIATSADGRRLSMYCQGDGTPARPDSTLVYDTASGQVVANLPAWARGPLNGDGTEAYGFASAGNDQRRLRRVEVATGTVLAEAAMLASGSIVQFDPRANRIFVLGRVLNAFDGTTLQSLGSRDLGVSGEQSGGTTGASLDENGARLYVTASGITEGNSSYAVSVFDTTTLAPLVSMRALFNGRFVATPKPLAPFALTSVVAAGGVTLAWTGQPSRATTLRYVVEAGTAPGLSNVTTFDVGLQTGLSVGQVPPGTYYVRVRAGNYIGLSAPSNEVVVQVQ